MQWARGHGEHKIKHIICAHWIRPLLQVDIMTACHTQLRFVMEETETDKWQRMRRAAETA